MFLLEILACMKSYVTWLVSIAIFFFSLSFILYGIYLVIYIILADFLFFYSSRFKVLEELVLYVPEELNKLSTVLEELVFLKN
jgi:hypothetical protein